MHPAQNNRPGAYRGRGRGEFPTGNRASARNYLRQQYMGNNPFPSAEPFRPMNPRNPRQAAGLPPTPTFSTHPQLTNFNGRSYYNLQPSPSMTPMTNFPTPLPYSVASLVGPSVNPAPSYPSMLPPTQQQHQQHQQHQLDRPGTPAGLPLNIPPYNIYGYGAPIDPMPQQQPLVMPTVTATPTLPPPVSVISVPSASTSGGNYNRAIPQAKYNNCSDISDSEDDLPQDLRVNKKQPQRNDMRGSAQQQRGAAATAAVATPESEQVNNHKKFQYKAWTTGMEPVPGPSSGTTASHDMGSFSVATTSPSTRRLESMVDELRLSPYITREQAIQRLYALGNKEEVQREIDAFAAIIRCGSINNVSFQPVGPVSEGNGNGGVAGNRDVVMDQGGVRQAENQRETVIKGHPNTNGQRN